MEFGNFRRNLPHCHLNGSPSFWQTIVSPQGPTHVAERNLSGKGWEGYELVMSSVPLCCWLGLALPLRTFPLGADERMDSRLIKRAAAGVEPTGVGWGYCRYCPSSLCDTWVFPCFINGYILCARYIYI